MLARKHVRKSKLFLRSIFYSPRVIMSILCHTILYLWYLPTNIHNFDTHILTYILIISLWVGEDSNYKIENVPFHEVWFSLHILWSGGN